MYSKMNQVKFLEDGQILNWYGLPKHDISVQIFWKLYSTNFTGPFLNKLSHISNGTKTSFWDSYSYTAQKLKFSSKDFFSKCDQIRSFLWIWSHFP